MIHNRNLRSLLVMAGLVATMACERSTQSSGEQATPDDATEQCSRTIVFVDDGIAPTDVRMAADFETPPWNGGIVLRDDERDGFGPPT